MKKVIAILMMLAVMVMATTAIDFASDSTYVATVDLATDTTTVVLNPNASMTLAFAPLTFVTTGDLSYNVNLGEITAATLAQKIEAVFGVFSAKATPTFDMLNDFTMTLPMEMALNVIPFTTLSAEWDMLTVMDGTGAITITANVVF